MITYNYWLLGILNDDQLVVIERYSVYSGALSQARLLKGQTRHMKVLVEILPADEDHVLLDILGDDFDYLRNNAPGRGVGAMRRALGGGDRR